MEVADSLKKAIVDYLRGDATAFTTIYNETSRYIYVCVRNVLNGNDNAEDMIQDVVQDTFVEISRHLDSLQNINTYLSWAGTIATRKCYEYIKKSNKYVLLNEDESFDNLSDDDNIIPEEILQNKEKQRLIREIISNELTDMQKLCVVGYYYNEMKQSEIAKELGIPENTVKSNLLRAKTKIKEGVIDLEKNKGTKLYSVAPLLLLLFTEEVQACQVPWSIGQGVATAMSANASVTAGQSAATIGQSVTVAGQGVTAAGQGVEALTTAGITGASTGYTTAGSVTSNVGSSLGKKIAIGAVALLGGAGIIAGTVATLTLLDDDKVNETTNWNDIEADNETNKKTEDSEEKTTTKEDTTVEEDTTIEEDTTVEEDKAETETTTEEATTEEVTKEVQIIPEGISYYDASSSKTLVAGDAFPEVVESDDKYITTEFEYTYNSDISSGLIATLDYNKVTFKSEGWNVKATKNYAGGEILDSILGLPVTDMILTFYNCEELTVPPIIPASIKSMPYAFLGCDNLTEMPKIPEGVTNMEGTFLDCKNLTSLTKLPDGITKLDYTYKSCTSITETPEFPNGITSMKSTFENCTKLTKVNELPSDLIYMDSIFKSCGSLVEVPAIPNNVISIDSAFQSTDIQVAPIIPNGVTNMNNVFAYCSYLIEAPVIPESVISLDYTFRSTNIQVAPVIPNSVTSMNYTFAHCNNLIEAPVIPESVTQMDSTFRGCESLTGTVVINANPDIYDNCFMKVKFEAQSLELAGSSTLLEELKMTAD